MQHPKYSITDVSAEGRRSLIHMSDVMGWVDSLGARPQNVHKSIFRYDSQIREYVREKGGTTAGYRGPAYADYLPIEIDGDDLEESGDVARQVVAAVQENLEIPQDGISIFYSGNRGYHILVPMTIFGEMEPSSEFHAVLAELALTILEDTDLVGYQEEHDAWRSSSVDLDVYAPQHMLRIPNTVHESSGLFKSQIIVHMTERPDEVREKAGEPRPVVTPESYESEAAKEVGNQVRERLNEGALRSTSKSGSMDVDKMLRTAQERAQSSPGAARYAARQQKYLDILEAEMVDGENRGGEQGRRRCLLSLVGHLKYHDIPKDEAIKWLELWNQANKEPLDDKRFYETIEYSYKR